MAEFSKVKFDYIEILGPLLDRFGPRRNINLTNYLPTHIREADTFKLVEMFEDYLNTMYVGNYGYVVSTSAINESQNGI